MLYRLTHQSSGKVILTPRPAVALGYLANDDWRLEMVADNVQPRTGTKQAGFWWRIEDAFIGCLKTRESDARETAK
jgi:hypothetical protein